MPRLVLIALLLAGCGVNKGTYQRAVTRITALEGELEIERRASADKDKKLVALGGELEQGKGREAAAAKEKEATIEAADKRIAAYKQLQEKFRALVAAGKVEVLFRNGQVVLKLPASALFPTSSSAKLSAAGIASLAEVTSVLDQFKSRRLLIAGHTDNQPIKTKAFPNNWYLSTARAVSVVELMIDAGFPAKNLGAAGYGAEDPIAANDTPKNREQNRRIEIILVPDLEELPSLTGQSP